MRWGSFTHLVKTASCTYLRIFNLCNFIFSRVYMLDFFLFFKKIIQSCFTFRTSLCFAVPSVTGCVVISNKRKFCFSVVNTPIKRDCYILDVVLIFTFSDSNFKQNRKALLTFLGEIFGQSFSNIFQLVSQF